MGLFTFSDWSQSVSRPSAKQVLTYMSRCPEIDALNVEGLYCVSSTTVGDDTPRTVYVTEEVWAVIKEPFSDDAEGQSHARFRQNIDSFLEGFEFTVAQDPFCKPWDADIARVDPIENELWDFRVLWDPDGDPHPGIRCLGGFWSQDTFVAITWDYRDNFDGHWNDEIDRCRRRWRDLFGAREPLKRSQLDEYLTNFDPV